MDHEHLQQQAESQSGQLQLTFALPNTQRLPHIKFVLSKAIAAQLERMNEKAPPVTDNEEEYNEE